jgi:hypothetical protein
MTRPEITRAQQWLRAFEAAFTEAGQSVPEAATAKRYYAAGSTPIDAFRAVVLARRSPENMLLANTQ